MATKASPRKSPAKKAPQPAVEPTPASQWKQPIPPVELPSGKYIKIRRVGIQAFMKVGIIPNSLMSTVQSAIDKGQSPELDVREMSQNQDQMVEMLQMLDDVFCFVAIDPVVHPAPKKESDRDPDLLYVDEVDDEDKMYIFGYVTGDTKDVATFRREQAAQLADLQRG